MEKVLYPWGLIKNLINRMTIAESSELFRASEIVSHFQQVFTMINATD